MKKSTIAIIVVVVILVAIIAGLVSSYNGVVSLSEEVDNKFATIDTMLQRRADLIPNLVETVKGYAKHEEDVFTKVTNARSAVSSAKTPEEYAKANDEMNEAIRSINVVVEAYPELKADKNFQNLQAELSGTENRIAVERQRFNESVRDFNLAVRKFPTNLVAGILGFHEREFFEISEGADQVPKVEF